MRHSNVQIATFGSGCFWCSEPLFNDLKGVSQVTVGYSGGPKSNPSYQEVSSGTSGHAEVIQVKFEPAIISYQQLLEVFFLTHNPTTLNRQGNDAGTQYRSVVYFHDNKQKTVAEQVKMSITSDHIYDHPIVTTIEPFTAFFPAESYHQHYYAKNPEQGYCQMVIDPKIAKFRKKFAALRKVVIV